MVDIFISYAREDQEAVRRLAAALEAQGWSVFWDRTIPAGETWRSYIGKALDDARCIVVAWSVASIESHWVQEEAEDARNKNILIPVLLASIIPPIGFRSITAAKLVGWDGDADDELFVQFRAAITRKLGDPPALIEERERQRAEAERKAAELKEKQREEAQRRARAQEAKQRRAAEVPTEIKGQQAVADVNGEARESPTRKPAAAEPTPLRWGAMSKPKIFISEGIPRQPPDSAQPKHAAEAALNIPDSYIEWIKGDFADISLLGLDPKEGQIATLRQVYVPAMTQADRIEQASQQHIERLELVHLLSRLAKESLYIPGAPGAGKTTFCKWLALCVATGEVPDMGVPPPEKFRESFPQALRGKLPVLCRLRDFYPKHPWQPDIQRFSASELLDALAAWIDKERLGGLDGASFKSFMAAGRTILILDGLDEVSSSFPLGRGEANPRAAILSGLKDALPGWIAAGNRILLTSRPYGLTADESRQLGLPEASLSPLPRALQQLFVQRWFATVSDRAEQMSSGLWTELENRDDLGPLRDNPMLLTAMCVKYQEGSRLPADITEMYDALVSYVLHNRYHKQNNKVEAARRRLGVIALRMHSGRFLDDSNSAPHDLTEQATAAISFSDIDRALREHNQAERLSKDRDFSALEVREDLLSNSGLLLPGGENLASFYHLSIQDFLAAERLDGIDAKAKDWLDCAAVKASWRQTFRFWFGRMMRPPGSPARALRAMDSLQSQLDVQSIKREPQAALLWSDCLELAGAKEKDLGDYGERYHDACMTALTTVDDPGTRARLFEVLGNLGLDDRPGVGLDAEGLPDILWVAVDAGRVELEDDQGTFDVPGFQMARYPVTWQQFESFVSAADGYANDEWWQELDKPTEHRSSHWQTPNAPRERASWFEAVAFCRWLSHQRGQTIRLPSEEEWQLAATGGDPAKVYPWGRKYIDGFANIHDGSYFLGRTSSVGIYPGGERGGIADLSGNVWEWTGTAVDFGNIRKPTGIHRLLRGGSWNGLHDYARSAYRGRSNPNVRNFNVGFRVLCSSPILSTDH